MDFWSNKGLWVSQVLFIPVCVCACVHARMCVHACVCVCVSFVIPLLSHLLF